MFETTPRKRVFENTFKLDLKKKSNLFLFLKPSYGCCLESVKTTLTAQDGLHLER